MHKHCVRTSIFELENNSQIAFSRGHSTFSESTFFKAKGKGEIHGPKARVEVRISNNKWSYESFFLTSKKIFSKKNPAKHFPWKPGILGNPIVKTSWNFGFNKENLSFHKENVCFYKGKPKFS